MRILFFDYKRQLREIEKEIHLAIKKVLNSGRLILGGEVKSFEDAFASYIGVKNGIGVNSGTDALKIAVRALGLKPSDEAITVSNTATPTVSAIRELSIIPKFVDVKDDFTIDENQIERAITSRTRAILPVHLYGQACNMKAIMKIAKKHKLAVIEDCCQAHGVKHQGKKVGTFGDVACFSFYPTKNLGAYGDGGMILTSSRSLADKCRALRMYGMEGEYYAKVEGYNSRLSEIQAAILDVKLKYLDQGNSRRREIALYYLKNITNPKIILPEISDLASHVFHLFVIRTPNRKKLAAWLAKNGIGYGVHYPYPVHLQSAYEFLGYKKGDLPKTEEFSRQIVSLPIFPELTDKEMKYIVKIINKF